MNVWPTGTYTVFYDCEETKQTILESLKEEADVIYTQNNNAQDGWLTIDNFPDENIYVEQTRLKPYGTRQMAITFKTTVSAVKEAM